MALAIHDTPIDAMQLVRDIARTTLDTARGLSASDRQWLHDSKRDRVKHDNTARLLELMTYADGAAAVRGPELIRGFVLAHTLPPVPFWGAASRAEQDANHLGDLAQLAWSELRTGMTADGLCEAMEIQALRSRIFADAVRVHASGRRPIHVVSR